MWSSSVFFLALMAFSAAASIPAAVPEGEVPNLDAEVSRLEPRHLHFLHELLHHHMLKKIPHQPTFVHPTGITAGGAFSASHAMSSSFGSGIGTGVHQGSMSSAISSSIASGGNGGSFTKGLAASEAVSVGGGEDFSGPLPLAKDLAASESSAAAVSMGFGKHHDLGGDHGPSVEEDEHKPFFSGEPHGDGAGGDHSHFAGSASTAGAVSLTTDSGSFAGAGSESTTSIDKHPSSTTTLTFSKTNSLLGKDMSTSFSFSKTF